MSKQVERLSEMETTKNENNNAKTIKNDKPTKPITKTQVMGRNRGAVLRLQQDYINLNKDPVPYIRAEPLPWNILEWHYVINGPENSPYYGGMFHGSLVFTQQYPFKPPSIYMRTPNGRFQTNRRLCLSISDYHPDEWNPAWSVSSILTGLLSFMLEESSALGTMVTSRREKLQFAYDSLQYNLKDHNFTTLFPDLCKEIKQRLAERESNEAKLKAVAASNTTNTDETTEDVVNGIRNRSSAGNIDDNGGFPHIILIICFCLGALIFHHAYNLEQLN
ncbi:ubiquitin-conjugating enzyme E2 J2 isoform X2 [Contarinia nasturtii]|uniref:ubiquitin-conjugating enzyme E2 J2 isoform X2 n=1 Tax=Contarinia nasturtii TaxID=265458 RepID=UPI0012D38538|nr:ubiquitin-conjugating enzyme E2 J2 isoform X2 [Contarinia nasturtii]